MPASRDAQPSQAARRRFPRLSGRAWIIVAAAFAAGLLLFGLIWLKQRDDHDFFHAPGNAQRADGAEFEPLPVPDTGRVESLPTQADAADETAAPAPSTDEPDAGADETPAPPVDTASIPAEDMPQPAPADSGSAARETSPVPVSSPAPRYPPAALRRGESGEALLRIQVLPDGSVGAIDLARSSGSRTLDRAALDAVRAWRFRPALRDGQPVASSVQIPIAFSAPR